MGADTSSAGYWNALRGALLDFLESRVGVTAGCRNIMDMARAMGEWPDNNMFLPFVSFDSQTESHPVGPVRARCPPALQREDAERIRFENLCRSELMDAARALLAYANKRAV